MVTTRSTQTPQELTTRLTEKVLFVQILLDLTTLLTFNALRFSTTSNAMLLVLILWMQTPLDQVIQGWLWRFER